MKVRIFLQALCLSAIVTVCSIGSLRAQGAALVPFEGVITYNVIVNIPQMGEQTMEMHTTVKGEKTVMDMDMGPMGGMHTFLDGTAHKMTVVMDNMKNGYEMDMPVDTAMPTAPVASNSAAATPAVGTVAATTPAPPGGLMRTGKTETINGYKAEEYQASTPKGLLDLWLTADLPADLRNALGQAMKHSPQNQGQQAKQIFSDIQQRGLAPVRIIFFKDNEKVATIDLVKVEIKKVDDKVFVIPSGIKISHQDLTKMRQQMQGGGQ
jgi:hypothetical protein